MISQYNLQFGNLAVNKCFINKEQLQQCLQYLEKHSLSISLEQFLQQQGFLSYAQVLAIKAELSPTQASVQPFVADRYKLLEEIGVGGMGRVYKVHDQKLNRVVALKRLLSLDNKHKEIERFYREARAMASLKHNNILHIHDLGVDHGQPYFTMDYIEGQALDKVEKPLSVQQIVQIMVKVGQAMGYAHKMGVIHRDLKPSNIVIDGDKEPKILDFGLAKLSSEDKKISQTGMIIGTLRYMPPEQALGEISNIDNRSDLYSLGAVLYKMLTGVPPFDGTSSMDIILKITHNELKFPSKTDIPEGLQKICLKAMQKKKEHRYQSAEGFVEDLSLFLQGKEVKASSLGTATKWWRQIKRNKVLFMATLLVIFSLSLLVNSKQIAKLTKKEPKHKIAKKAKPNIQITSPKELQNNSNVTFENSKNLLNLKIIIAKGPGIKVSINREKEVFFSAQKKKIELNIPLQYGQNKIGLQTWNGENWQFNRKLNIFRTFPANISMFQGNAMHTGVYPPGNTFRSGLLRYNDYVDSPVNLANGIVYYGSHKKGQKEGILIARNNINKFKRRWVYEVPSYIASFPLAILFILAQ